MTTRNGNQQIVFDALDRDPNQTPKELSARLGIPQGTASSAKTRWKKLHPRTVVVDDRSNGHEKPTVVQEPEQTAEPEATAHEVVDSVQLAGELLHQAVEAIRNFDAMAAERNSFREEVIYLNARLKKVEEERDRIMKVHNEIVTQANAGKIPSVEEVVKVLRRGKIG